ncbi:hypothetical protein PR202_ga30589 [Eleusine coracana subsp. coracana]|uniref:RING-type domain-containing protein n=1 Tax=Eleusine coracana subsp. coracana TaxID=191504 RepID=A0AAV5DPB7_ELECO|nr:hypothetical protein QOZ80_8AG0619120 [Eleusine coracana subsp. coracana]GJN12320.1 hypothetical protein PR202_ga30589 [Eleusine coracana subsp. coracana]
MGVIILNVGPSETLSISRELCITAMSLQIDPAAYARGRQRDEVNAWVQVVGHDESRCAIGTVSAASPVVELRPRLVINDKFLLRHDAAADTVRFYARLPQPPRSVAGEVEEESRTAVLDYDGEDEETVVEEHDVAEEASTWVEFRPLTEEEEAERFDSDNDDEGEEDDDKPPQKVMASKAGGESSNNTNIIHPQVAVVPDGEFLGLGPARFAAVENTAAFMRVAVAEAAGEGNKEITVLYRYTRFSRTWSGRRGVEACRRTKLHRLKFNVPPAGDAASSLAWAGAALGPLVYPALFRRQLQELWTTLLSPAMSAVPPGATRLQVIVDAAILRSEDYTPERMDHMRGAMEEKMREAWPEYCHVGMDLHLPEPARRRREEDEQGGADDDVTPAKRRKIADDEEDCAVCFDTMERGLAAWPGCRHVFHGACLERTLARSDMCPLCRNKLCAADSTS